MTSTDTSNNRVKTQVWGIHIIFLKSTISNSYEKSGGFTKTKYFLKVAFYPVSISHFFIEKTKKKKKKRVGMWN